MAYSVQAIKYGWAALIGIAITGTTIYVTSNTRKHVKPVDIIELSLAITERCFATQTSTDPTYAVTPPYFVRTWYSNVYSSNGVTTYSQIMTNTIGRYIDKPMMVELDAKIKAIVPCYGWNNNPGENMTFTGLLVHLNIGDGTNFTRTPAIGTNPATYGDYPQQIYVTDLQERYKVLEACKYFIDQNKSVVDSISWRGSRRTTEFYREAWSNNITGVFPEYSWSPNIQAYLAELPEFYYYTGNPDYNFYNEGTNQLHRNPTWDESKDNAEWAWYWWRNGYEITNTPPYKYYTNYHSSTFSSYEYVGEVCRAGKYIDIYDNDYNYYETGIELRRTYGTVRWANYQYTNIPSTFAVYYKGATNYFYDFFEPYETEIETNGPYIYPREWAVDTSWSFQETMTPSANYQKLDDSFISQTGVYNQVVFGSDEFPELVYADSVPPFCDEPVGGLSWKNNEGSVFKEKGMRIDFCNISGVREYQFTYCTNKFW